MTWAADQPVGTHLLADPSHAVRYGSSVRAASAHDVYLEEDKDVAIAIYSSTVAREITRRLDDLGDFARSTPDVRLRSRISTISTTSSSTASWTFRSPTRVMASQSICCNHGDPNRNRRCSPDELD